MVRDLLKQLIAFRDVASSISKSGKIKSSQYPPNIKEQAANLYIEHGGMDILIEILHVNPSMLRSWIHKMKENPDYYKVKDKKKVAGSAISDPYLYVKKSQTIAKDLALPKKRIHWRQNNAFKARENFLNCLDENIQKRCEEIRNKINLCNIVSNASVPYDIRKDVVNMIEEVGNPKPIAILLGINEKILSQWKNYFTMKDQVYEISD